MDSHILADFIKIFTIIDRFYSIEIIDIIIHKFRLKDVIIKLFGFQNCFQNKFMCKK